MSTCRSLSIRLLFVAHEETIALKVSRTRAHRVHLSLEVEV